MIKTLLFLTTLAVSQAAERSLTVPDPGCPPSGHWLLPHEYDCTKFYYCDRGHKFVTPSNCPGNTEFSVPLQICTHIGSSGCTLTGPSSISPPSIATTTPSPLPTEFPLIITTPEPLELLENGCPADIFVHKLLPHETSCTEFYYCVHGQKVLRSCGPGTFFNPAIQNCDHPFNVDRNCDEPDQSGSSSNESGSSVSDENSSNQDDVSDSNSNENSSSDYSSSEDDTSSSSDENVSSDSSEDDNSSTSSEDINSSSSSEDDNSSSSSEDDDSSSSYENDSSGSSEDDKSSSQEESNSSENDDSKELDDDIDENGCPIEWSLKKSLPHEYYCSKSYQCVYGDLEDKSCPQGTHFSYDVLVSLTRKKNRKKETYATLKICVIC